MILLNTLKVDGKIDAHKVALALSMIDVSDIGELYRDVAVDLIKSQQSRIDLLESAVRDWVIANKSTETAEDGCSLGDINLEPFERMWAAEENLRKLMQQAK